MLQKNYLENIFLELIIYKININLIYFITGNEKLFRKILYSSGDRSRML